MPTEVVEPGVAPAAASGDQLATLRALRDALARQIDAARDPFGLPALADKLVKVLAEIARIAPEDKSKGTALDELARRRQSRAAGAGRAAGGDQRR